MRKFENGNFSNERVICYWLLLCRASAMNREGFVPTFCVKIAAIILFIRTPEGERYLVNLIVRTLL